MKPTNEPNPAGSPREPEPMTAKELLEFAVVDAFGLLDEDDRIAFDRGYNAAPATLRDLIWSQQARAADCLDMLPDDDAPDALRDRTLGRIGAEIARKSRPAPGPEVHRVAHEPAVRAPRLQRARRVNAGWRVATVAMSVAAVVLGVLHVQLRREFNTVQDRAGIARLIDTIGTENIEATLFDETAKRVYFRAAGEVARARAMLIHASDSDQARLYIANFSGRTDYRLVVLDENDNPGEVLATFKASGLISGVNIRLRGSGTVRLAILTDEAEPQRLFVADVLLA